MLGIKIYFFLINSDTLLIISPDDYIGLAIKNLNFRGINVISVRYGFVFVQKGKKLGLYNVSV
jgi:hypothetical protein